MKPIDRVKRLIEERLSSKEVWELASYCQELARKKRVAEHIAEIKAIGKGNKVLVRGGSTETVRQGLACLVGTIVRYGPKRVRVRFSERREWHLPYDWLVPATEENIKKERELREHAEMVLPLTRQINKIFTEEMQ